MKRDSPHPCCNVNTDENALDDLTSMSFPATNIAVVEGRGALAVKGSSLQERSLLMQNSSVAMSFVPDCRCPFDSKRWLPDLCLTVCSSACTFSKILAYSEIR